MSPDLEKNIIEKYPELFTEIDYFTNEKTIKPCSFSCGDGWFNIIDTLCKNITYYIESETRGLEEEDSRHYQVRLVECKEKYGSLRLYAYGADDYVRGMIVMAEEFSSKICEDCGGKGEVTTKGWIRNLCNSCYNKIK